MSWFGKLWCFIFFHKLYVVNNYSKYAQKLYCGRCKNYFGIHHGVKVFIPWDDAMEETMEIMLKKN